MKLSVQQYKQKLIAEFGFASPLLVQEYADARRRYKLRLQGGDFNPFNADPNCKTCGKRKHTQQD